MHEHTNAVSSGLLSAVYRLLIVCLPFRCDLNTDLCKANVFNILCSLHPIRSFSLTHTHTQARSQAFAHSQSIYTETTAVVRTHTRTR